MAARRQLSKVLRLCIRSSSGGQGILTQAVAGTSQGRVCTRGRLRDVVRPRDARDAGLGIRLVSYVPLRRYLR